MIYGNSNHPVLIKKIDLKIWTLRDEIEAIIKNRVEKQGQENLDLNDLVEEYKVRELKTEKPLTLIKGEKVSEGESEMIKAMEEAEGEEPKSATDLDEEQSQGLTPEQQLQQEVQILRRAPSLPEARIFSGKTLLAEIDMQGIYFFCQEKFAEGQSIVIDFQIPMRFVVNADVLYCRPYNMKSRIISANRLPYRVAARFSFLKEGERTLLRNFITSIEADIKEPTVLPKKVNGGDADDNFDDLDDFDI